jgi:diguanylate cyclase (GGDEF)-like protein/PAS domain S-box-containing protein
MLVASLIYERNQALHSGMRTTESLALVIAEQTTRTIQTVDQRLQLAASGLIQLQAKQGLDENSARTLLRQHLQQLPFVRAMWVLDAQGQIQYDSDIGNIGMNLADRPYFQIYKRHPNTAFSLGKPIRSRSTGTWLISAARPLISEDGQFRGVIVAAIEPPYFDALWSQVDLGEGGSVALLHRQGDLVMRSPFNDTAMGKNFSESPLFRDHLPNAASGQFLDPSPVDGVERLFVYRTLSAQPDYVVIIGTARERLMANWRQYAYLASGIWLSALALIAMLCWILARSWSKQDRARRDATQMAKRLSLGTDAAGVAVWDWDVTTDAWYATPTYSTMLGYEADEGPGNRQQWVDRVHPEDQAMVSAKIQAALDGLNTPYEYEARLRHANGTWRWMRVVGRVLESGQDRKPKRLMGVRTDITQYRVASDQLRLSEENLAITLRSIGDAVIASDQSGRITQMNPTAERLTGWPLDEARDRPLSEVFRIIDAQTRLPAVSPVDRVMEHGNVVALANHTALIDRSGREYQISDSGAPIRDAQHNIVGVVLVFSDVTEQYRVRQELAESEERFRKLIEWTPGPIAVHVRGVIVYANPATLKLFGASVPAQLVGRPILDFVHPEFRDIVFQRTQAIAQTGATAPMMEEMFLRLDGSVLHLEVEGIRISYNGEPAVQVAMHDTTARVNAERILRQTEESLRQVALHTQTILNNLMDGVVTITPLGIVESFNLAASIAFGYDASEVIGHNINMLMPEAHKPHHDGYLARYARTGERKAIGKTLELEGRHKSGRVFPMTLQVSEIELGGKTTYVGVVRDITQHRQDVEEIRRLAFFDALTQLPNRTSFTDRLRHAVLANARTGHHGALMFLDLDHFKQLNDTRGHDVGDLLLQQVAHRLQGCVRAGDSVARLGGDEFVVLLESLSPQEQDAATQAEAIANKILQALGQPYTLRDTSYDSTPSIGIVIFSQEPESIEELLKKADVAMYQAKSAGRNTARFFDPAMQAAAAAYVELEADLRRGLANHEFILHYQIQVDFSGETTGAEALVRWEHPTRGLVSPAQFIAMAEETGIILTLGQWVLRTACQQLAQWAEQDATRAWTMAVNVSASQFAQSGFVSTVAAALSESGADPYCLKLELTESMLVDDVNGVIEKMNQIKAMGVGFSLDDFGTGYSSLSYLKRLPLDQLKIDQSFVRDILTDASDAVIARTIIGLGQSLGLKVIAEGVETAEQRDSLIGLGCEAFQGYYFGRPVPALQLFLRSR